MKRVRIGSGLGFYGDSWRPVRATLERGEVQYVASDHLSELTLAILQKDREKNPDLGYTQDLVPMMRELWPLAQRQGVKFLLNAGGLNPLGAQEALRRAFEAAGLEARIAAVTGDAVGDRLAGWHEAGLRLSSLEDGEEFGPVQDRLVFANAYLGARSLAEALAMGADIVVAGRVADAALFLAPLVHEFGWAWDDWDRLARGIVVGHLLECSGQASGGNFGGDWRSVPDLAHLGYPIAEVSEDGSAIVTKAPGTGGRVDFDTLREQLLYEVHDPHRYVTPDVVVDLGTVTLDDLGNDRVRVAGATGHPRPADLKVVGGFPDGYMAQAMVGFAWPDAFDKARAAASIVEVQAKELGVPFDELRVEYVGVDSLHGPLADRSAVASLNEVYLRMAARVPDKQSAERFGRLFPPLGLSGPPFIGGYGGLTPPRALLGIWTALVPRALVEPGVQVAMVEVGA